MPDNNETTRNVRIDGSTRIQTNQNIKIESNSRRPPHRPPNSGNTKGK